MSNIKVNGNTYNDVSSVRFMKADNSGYATYKEGASDTDTMFDTLINQNSIGDYESDLAKPNLNWLSDVSAGTVSFPYATSAYACVEYCRFDNLLLPNVTQLEASKGVGARNYMKVSKFSGCIVTGVLDLTSLETVSNNTVNFQYCNIGTLKLGSYVGNTNLLSNVTIENLVWNMPDSTGLAETTCTTTLNAATAITNLYVPSARVDEIQALIDDGTITKITNVYSIDDWED